jgi:hypothetical protein
MKELVIEEMKRAIEIMESKPEELSSKKKCETHIIHIIQKPIKTSQN